MNDLLTREQSATFVTLVVNFFVQNFDIIHKVLAKMYGFDYNTGKVEKRGRFMYKLCKTEQSARRQKELEQGLLKIMLQSRYEDISVSELCDNLNIPRKSFYRY